MNHGLRSMKQFASTKMYMKRLSVMEICKKQKNVTNYACFCAATMLTSNIIAEIIENLSEFSQCTNGCNKFVSSRYL